MAVSHNSLSPYKHYMSDMNNYLDRNDKLLQVELKNKNKNFIDRNKKNIETKKQLM